MRSLFLTLALSSLASSLLAQEEESSTTVRFLSFPESAKTPVMDIAVSEDKAIEVDLPSHVLSRPYKLPGSGPWKLGKAVPSTEGEPSFKSYGTIKPSSAKRQLAIILFTGKKPSDGFKSLVIDETKFDYGQLMLLNFFPKETAAVIGGKKFKLKPGQKRILTPEANRGKNLCHANLLMLKDDKWKSFYTSNWPVHDDSRGLVFLYPKRNAKSPALHTIIDNQ